MSNEAVSSDEISERTTKDLRPMKAKGIASCAEQSRRSLECLTENNRDKDICAKEIEAFKKCKKEYVSFCSKDVIV